MNVKKLSLVLAGILVLFAGAAGGFAYAQDASTGDFSLQVSPSPIVETIKPGIATNLELKIRNTGSQKEALKMGMRSFTINKDTGEVALGQDEPKEVTEWVRFTDPVFSVEPGEWFTQKFTINTPESAGFSYSFALTISRNQTLQPSEGTTALEGTVAVFALLSVDKPGAERKFEIELFGASKKLYEYLPADLTATFKNTGNTIVQPSGTIFISRPGSNDPIATLPVNSSGAYVLPDSSRVLSASWAEGFPVFTKTKSADNVAETTKLSWDFSNVHKFRFGTYEAKIVAVYNDGQRDVPVTATVEFRVFPWKMLVIAGIILLVLMVGIVTIIHKAVRVARFKNGKKKYSEDA